MDDKLVKSTQADVNKWDKPMNLLGLSVNEMRFLGQTMADSGMFPDLQKDAAKAMVKIAAGQEIGVPPFQAMTGINIIAGKAAMGANLIAAKIKSSGKYDYKVKATDDSCMVTITQKDKEVGNFTYTMTDAKRQGLANKDNWVKYPANMLFARAITTAQRMFAPDALNGVIVYDPDELDGAITPDGHILDMTEEQKTVHDAVEAIDKATDEDQLTDIVTNLPTDIQKLITEQATAKFAELAEPKEAK